MWWGWLESNQLPRRYERPALTDELHPRIIIRLTGMSIADFGV